MHTRRTVRSKKRQMKYRWQLIWMEITFWGGMTLAAFSLVAMWYVATYAIFSL